MNLYSPGKSGRSEFVTLRGLRTHLNVWGTPALATPQRPPLVLLHGWMDVGASFQFMVDALRDERYIVAPDWRGFGLTDSPQADCYWFPDYLGDLDALIDLLSPAAPVDLLGHSMGGNVAMMYTGTRPARIRRLANLEGFGVPATPGNQAPQRLAQWLDELKAPQGFATYDSVQAVAARLQKTNPLLAPDKAAWLAQHWARPDAQGRWHILGDAAHKRVNPALSRTDEILALWQRITMPVLWVQGDQSNPDKWWQGRYSRAEFETRLAVVKDVQRCELAPAGHMLHHDQPQALAQRLEAFLNES